MSFLICAALCVVARCLLLAGLSEQQLLGRRHMVQLGSWILKKRRANITVSAASCTLISLTPTQAESHGENLLPC